MKPKILVSRKISDLAEEKLQKEFEVTLNPKDEPIPESELIKMVNDYDGMISTGFDKIGENFFKNLSSRKIIKICNRIRKTDKRTNDGKYLLTEHLFLYCQSENAEKLNFFINLVVPVLFGISLLFLWQVLTVGLKIPHILLPSPLKIGIAFSNSIPMLWEDFQQTFLKAVLSGYFMGCFSGFIIAIMVDRIPFLQKGLLPLGNLISALPIIGIAPIMVMWFGFDWQSKAAVVVIMTFFPMLVNTITGLSVTGQIEKDLLHSYAANYWQNLILLRIPVSLPFVFNALKINSTLALIGAIVAEFFGTPIVGMGFRISAEIGRLNVDIVWATILVAAVSGSMFYALITICERSLTSWHPSIREN